MSSFPDTSSTTLRPSAWRAYHRATRSGTYGFLAALPLLLAYEFLIQFVNRGRTLQVRLSSDVWIKQLLAWLGAGGSLVLTGIVCGLGLLIVYLERRRHIPLRTNYFAGIILESALYAVGVAAIVSGVVGYLFAPLMIVNPAAGPQVVNLWQSLALSIGAGIYEELLFRVLLVGGLFLLFRRLGSSGASAYVPAAVLGALLFSGVHYVGALGDPFTLPSFTFRFLFGLALNALYLLRGFGVATWTHALYDIMVVTHFIG